MARKVHVLHPLWAWLRMRYSLLLVAQLLVFLVYPFVLDSPAGVVVMGGFISVTVISGAWSMGREHRRIAMILAVPMVVLLAASIVTRSDHALLATCLIGVACVGYEILRIFAHALEISRVTLEKVQASLAVFLLLGLAFALAYSILELMAAGSFSTGNATADGPFSAGHWASPHMRGFSHLLFHSYMTLCATTYGTVTAVSPPALALTALETLIGQLYIAILVAQLMGLHLAFSAKR